MQMKEKQTEYNWADNITGRNSINDMQPEHMKGGGIGVQLDSNQTTTLGHVKNNPNRTCIQRLINI